MHAKLGNEMDGEIPSNAGFCYMYWYLIAGSHGGKHLSLPGDKEKIKPGMIMMKSSHTQVAQHVAVLGAVDPSDPGKSTLFEMNGSGKARKSTIAKAFGEVGSVLIGMPVHNPIFETPDVFFSDTGNLKKIKLPLCKGAYDAFKKHSAT